MCELALYTQYFPELCEETTKHITWVGFEPTTLAILVSYQLGLLCFKCILTPIK